MRSTLSFLALLIFGFVFDAAGQDPTRFAEEVAGLVAKDDVQRETDLILFTGSSSVRFWSTLASDFDGSNVLNRGFGGSTFPDLLHYQDELIFKYNPSKIFIYEGDNDIFMNQEPEQILANAKLLASNIHKRLPDAKIYFIAAKPSVARWELREAYKHFNYILSSWTSFEEKISFVDVWTPMCDENGAVFKDLFIADNLHMNAKGYKIWAEVMAPYVKE